MFRIFTTKEFDREFDKLDNTEKLRILKIKEQIEENGGNIGKPLSGLSFFREKYFQGKRLYFLVYKEHNSILIVAISDKKNAQSTINEIMANLENYKNHIRLISTL